MPDDDSTNPISLEHASLNTASVTIRVIEVNGKSMTLSVFRQLPIGDARRAVEGAEGIEVWGKVNYFWAGCCLPGDHLHIVYSFNGILYRVGVTEVTFECDEDADDGDTLDSSDDERDRFSCKVQGDPAFIDRLETWCRESDKRHDRRLAKPNGVETFEFELPASQLADFKRKIDRWNERVRHLKDLRQIFIAV